MHTHLSKTDKQTDAQVDIDRRKKYRAWLFSYAKGLSPYAPSFFSADGFCPFANLAFPYPNLAGPDANLGFSFPLPPSPPSPTHKDHVKKNRELCET